MNGRHPGGKFYLQDASAKLQVQIAAVSGRLAQAPHPQVGANSRNFPVVIAPSVAPPCDYDKSSSITRAWALVGFDTRGGR